MFSTSCTHQRHKLQRQYLRKIHLRHRLTQLNTTVSDQNNILLTQNRWRLHQLWSIHFKMMILIFKKQEQSNNQNQRINYPYSSIHDRPVDCPASSSDLPAQEGPGSSSGGSTSSESLLQSLISITATTSLAVPCTWKKNPLSPKSLPTKHWS